MPPTLACSQQLRVPGWQHTLRAIPPRYRHALDLAWVQQAALTMRFTARAHKYSLCARPADLPPTLACNQRVDCSFAHVGSRE
jgi:hypothetical protein